MQCQETTAREADLSRQAKSSGPQLLYQIAVTVYGQLSGIIVYEPALLPHCAVNNSMMHFGLSLRTVKIKSQSN